MCDEGRYNYKWLDMNRIQEPAARVDGKLNPESWESIISAVASRLKETIAQHGKSSVAVISSAKMSNEDALSIVAYLRTLTSINNEVPKRKLQISFHPTIPTADLKKNVRPAFAEIPVDPGLAGTSGDRVSDSGTVAAVRGAGHRVSATAGEWRGDGVDRHFSGCSAGRLQWRRRAQQLGCRQFERLHFQPRR